MYPFRKLSVWRRAHALALQVHEVTERSYQGRYWPLIDRMRYTAVAIASSIVAGSGQVTGAEFARDLTIALRSARALDYQVLLARDLGVLPISDCVRLDARVEQVSRMLSVLRRRVVERPQAPGSLTAQGPRRISG